jgi:hypothetical protein
VHATTFDKQSKTKQCRRSRYPSLRPQRHQPRCCRWQVRPLSDLRGVTDPFCLRVSHRSASTVHTTCQTARTQGTDPYSALWQSILFLCAQTETARQLYEILNKCEIVLLCDDSGRYCVVCSLLVTPKSYLSSSLPRPSMASSIVEPVSQKTTTRWMELKRLAAIVIEYAFERYHWPLSPRRLADTVSPV